jgi:hypothetical protein
MRRQKLHAGLPDCLLLDCPNAFRLHAGLPECQRVVMLARLGRGRWNKPRDVYIV